MTVHPGTHAMVFRPLVSACLLLSSSLTDCAKQVNRSNNMTVHRDSISIEMRDVLDTEFRRWYPLAMDTVYGGFFSDINADWELDGGQDKFIVTQARHVWSTAHAAVSSPGASALLRVAAHGMDFLKNTMWDREYGGFYNMVDRRGEPLKGDGQIIKQAYGNAFALYGLAAYYKATGDTSALHLAQETFQWLERHSFDPVHGGYFQFMSRDGTPFTEGYKAPPKDQNSTIHLLESFTEFYKVWPDALLWKRLHALLHILRDTITAEKGYLVLFFARDWTPVSFRDAGAEVRERNYEFDHVSFGHDVETAYLMLEASNALGLTDDTTTLRVAKKMVDHALAYGWDTERGGFFDGGYYAGGADKPSIVRNTKEWWAQAEALNTLLLMSDLFPGDAHRYYETFCRQWDYCKKYVIDNERGGWYWGGADIVPGNRQSAKGSIWKCNYHTSRALINCIERIKHVPIPAGTTTP